MYVEHTMKSRDNKGTIRAHMRYLLVSRDVWGGQDTLGGRRGSGYCRGKAVTTNRWR